MAIGCYSINDYWWLLYKWLLMDILLVVLINGYWWLSYYGYWWLLIGIILVVIGGYNINGYW